MTFEEWLDEIENYGSRQERLGEELPISDTLIQWLRAAYDVGYEHNMAEHLQAKKKAIGEELYDKVKMEMFKASSKLEGIEYNNISRVEVIGPEGREYVRYFEPEEFMYTVLQDDNRTLKIFIQDEF